VNSCGMTEGKMLSLQPITPLLHTNKGQKTTALK
jgi:hypothetical protein